jgi:hypothetical protein
VQQSQAWEGMMDVRQIEAQIMEQQRRMAQATKARDDAMLLIDAIKHEILKLQQELARALFIR